MEANERNHGGYFDAQGVDRTKEEKDDAYVLAKAWITIMLERSAVHFTAIKTMVAQKPSRTKLFESAILCMHGLSTKAVTSHQAFAVEVTCEGSRAGHPLIGLTITVDSKKERRISRRLKNSKVTEKGYEEMNYVKKRPVRGPSDGI